MREHQRRTLYTAPTCKIGINSWKPFCTYDVLLEPCKFENQSIRNESTNWQCKACDIHEIDTEGERLPCVYLCTHTSKKIFVIRLFAWISGSLVVIFVNLSLYKVAIPLKCQQNVFVNLRVKEFGGKRIYWFRLSFIVVHMGQGSRYLLQQTIRFINRTVMIFN